MHPYKNQLIQGDTLAVLKGMPEDIIDLGITSPPYNKQEKNNGWLVSKVVYADYKDVLPEKEYQKKQSEVLDEVYRITKEGGSFFYNHKIRWVNGEMFHPMDWLRKTKWVVKQEIIWDRTIAGNIRGWRFWQVEERVYWLYKPIGDDKKGEELQSKDAKMTSVWRAVPENHNPHPAPFPIWLPTRVILSLLPKQKSAIILDPYVGSGTTAVAAKLLGFDYLGIDISQEYLEYAEKRLKEYKSELEKVEKERSIHFVKKSFKQRKEEGLYQAKTNNPLFRVHK
ncbi:MAG: site-specific DNA-methyltransferase [Candidatus Kaiserbacteria bacterium]|nr:site-specific DNA-methyltransferase [Candidatus Kaiserbacteria bacterium]